MRYLVALILSLCAQVAHTQEWEDRQVFGGEAPAPSLRIISSTDTSFFAPVITRFLERRPGVSVEYLVTGTTDLDRRFRTEPGAYDLVISSAMDLQLKLANDGFAARLDGLDHPQWAQWRQSLFAFTTEPAAIVVSRRAFAGAPLPTTRQQLIEAMRLRPEVFRGRIGTYDVRQSGLGYLFATQDARASETYWRLMEVMGRLDVRLYCCSGEMIDDLREGTLVMAYNVLGSYAEAEIAASGDLAIVLPADFPTTMMRTVLISRDAPAPALSEAFLRHLLDHQARGDTLALPSLSRNSERAEQAIIPLEPALMTFLDALKRRMFLKEWEDAVIQR